MVEHKSALGVGDIILNQGVHHVINRWRDMDLQTRWHEPRKGDLSASK